eukprot:TRINITY_DN305_c0_g1_i1.p1 TRINITY_DN305_c0_g1~~TRINITY_DN305_c0_g1_i1.p1  ORF type:complete len:521 (-),score=81.61 TRINITY_DN305_c0_g1_i1:54-1508(-)
MCVNCIRNQVDITEGISKQVTIHYCRLCGRYLQPPTHWVACELESKELLTLCIKKVKGLSKAKLIDASFIWTEPHSRRIKLKITIQKEVFAATILQQTFVVEFIVHPQQCLNCTRIQTNESTWIACVQLRQKVDHKRTFYFLEQLILKHQAHTNTTNIKEHPDGIDFYFNHRSHALKFVDFLHAVIPIRSKTSERLISHDSKSNNYNYKYSFSVEISPVCRDDLVCLPAKVATSFGGMNPLLLCVKISSLIHMMDPFTLQARELNSTQYWKTPFRPVGNSRQLVNYIVLDVVPLGPTLGKFALADVQVAKESDFGVNDIQYLGRTHLGNYLKPGDNALGYDFANMNFNDDAIDELKRHSKTQLPDFILVKKHFINRRKKQKPRFWKLKDLPMEEAEPIRKNEKIKHDNDYEKFLQDIEEDPELRAQIDLYKTSDAEHVLNAAEGIMEDEGEEEEEDFPEVKLDELLEDLTLNDDDDQEDGDGDE